jgi:hypothetical protein
MAKGEFLTTDGTDFTDGNIAVPYPCHPRNLCLNEFICGFPQA